MDLQRAELTEKELLGTIMDVHSTISYLHQHSQEVKQAKGLKN